jgi:outer membrane protein assembly factor BamC
MKKTNLLAPLLCSAVLLNLSACGYIKSLFPDKEKDYQFTTEIPELILPPNLGNGSGLKKPEAAVSANKDIVAPIEAAATVKTVDRPVITTTPVADNQAVESGIAITPLGDEPAIVETPIDNTDSTTVADKTLQAKPEPIPVELIKADGSGRLRLGVPFDKAWRTIDKALSRNTIEVTNRNKQDNSFALRYDPNEKKLEDGSLWDEVSFMFQGFQGDEKGFFVKLIDSSTETNQQTDVVITDEAHKPSTDADALNLLTLLQKTIKADFAK